MGAQNSNANGLSHLYAEERSFVESGRCLNIAMMFQQTTVLFSSSSSYNTHYGANHPISATASLNIIMEPGYSYDTHLLEPAEKGDENRETGRGFADSIQGHLGVKNKNPTMGRGGDIETVNFALGDQRRPSFRST